MEDQQELSPDSLGNIHYTLEEINIQRANVTGININDYQLARAKILNKRDALDGLVECVKGKKIVQKHSIYYRKVIS